MVVVRFMLDTEGTPQDVQVVQSSLHPGLDAAGVAVASELRFHPGYWQGKPVKVQMTMPIRFPA